MFYKVFFKKEVHVFSLEKEATIQELNRQINQVFAKLPRKYILTYKDDQGDEVTLGNNNDLKVLIESGTKKAKLFIQETSEAFFDQTQQFVLETVQQKSFSEYKKENNQAKIDQPQNIQPDCQYAREQPEPEQMEKQELNEQNKKVQTEQQKPNQYSTKPQTQQNFVKRFINFKEVKATQENKLLVGIADLSPGKKGPTEISSSILSSDSEKRSEIKSQPKQEEEVFHNETETEKKQEIFQFQDQGKQYENQNQKINYTTEVEIQTEFMGQQYSINSFKQNKQAKLDYPEASQQIIIQHIQKKMPSILAQLKASFAAQMKVSIAAQVQKKFQRSAQLAPSLPHIKSGSQKVQHKSYSCSLCCEKPIMGVRYQCTFCEDYNLCETCQDFEDHGHPFIKVKNPNLCPQVIKAQLAAERKAQLNKKQFQQLKQKIDYEKKELYKKHRGQQIKKKNELSVKDKKEKLAYLTGIFGEQQSKKLMNLIEKYPHLDNEALVNHYLENQKQFNGC